MLRELHISNLAVIADVRIELSAGLNCFTGATGAGKSLIIGALEVLLGLRSPSEMLRTGADEGRVAGVFEINNPQTLVAIDKICDLPIGADGGEVLLTRRLYSSGRSAVSLNGNPITLGMLKQVAETLVDVHGQHDHQYLLRPSNQLDVLDQFGGHLELRAEYHDAYGKLLATQQQIEALSASQSLRVQKLELYRFQAAEIDAAELNPAEMPELESRAAILQNLEKLKKDAGGAYQALYEADGAVIERLKMIWSVLADLAMLDVGLKPLAQNTREATIQLEDASYDLSRYLDRLDLDPAELTEVNARLDVLNRVLKKYGPAIPDAIALRGDLEKQITELQKESGDLSGLTKQLAPLTKAVKRLGEDLSARRNVAGRKLAPLVQAQLAELGMEKAKFSVSLSPAIRTLGDGAADKPENALAQAAPSGFDMVEFIVQTNPGQAPQPLRKIASGGEMSRIMLGLKSILAGSDRVSVLVFDEIDANIGGRLGSTIGAKLRNLSLVHQVLCITHLPQIASFADRHLTVGKSTAGGETTTQVRQVNGQDRVAEIAEMIGGQHITSTTLAQAAELLEAGSQSAATQVNSNGKAAGDSRVKTKADVSPKPASGKQPSSKGSQKDPQRAVASPRRTV